MPLSLTAYSEGVLTVGPLERAAKPTSITPMDRTVDDFYLNRSRFTAGLNIAPSSSVIFKLNYLFNHTFGDGGFIDSETFVFNADGSFNAARAAGGSRGGTSVSSSSAHGGRYRLAGHALELAYGDGRTLRLFFGFFPDSDRALCLGPRSYSMD